MSGLDPRLHAFRPDLAAASLRGRVDAPRFAEGAPARLGVGRAALRRAPSDDAPMDTEILFGEAVTVFDRRDGWAWCQCVLDSYVGYVREAALIESSDPITHRVAVPRTFIYPAPDIKAPPIRAVPMNARLSVERIKDRFAVLAPGGFAMASHLAPIAAAEPDHAAVAQRFLGAPYLWGGKTWDGIDCSGLAQTALQAAGIAAPRDTDLQRAAFPEIDSAEARRGDLVFWRGHVALVLGDGMALHANAHHMQVACEPLAAACARIERSGSGILAVCRPAA